MPAPPPLIIFDDGLGEFGPMTDLRAAFEIRSGMVTTGERIARVLAMPIAGYWAPERLRALVAERAGAAAVNHLSAGDAFLCVNGRAALLDGPVKLARAEALIDPQTQHVVVAHLARADAAAFLDTWTLPPLTNAKTQAIGAGEGPPKRLLCRYPWEILAASKETIRADILATRILDARILGEDVAIVGSEPVEVHASARVYPNVVFDAEGGPIMVHERAVIRPGAIICGPCSIGPDSVVIDRAHIKPHTVIGPFCKVGGEVGATIFQGFSNKAHDGHLGDSWVGEWVNLGAGTTNSNLLNTYGEVVMRLEPEGQRYRTGVQFLGAIVGDHAKFAIGTRIMTGSVIGTGAMIATSAPPPTTVPRFAWLTDEALSSKRFRLEKFLDIARTVMARRNVEPSEAYLSRIRELHSAATDQRQ